MDLNVIYTFSLTIKYILIFIEDMVLSVTVMAFNILCETKLAMISLLSRHVLIDSHATCTQCKPYRPHFIIIEQIIL